MVLLDLLILLLVFVGIPALVVLAIVFLVRRSSSHASRLATLDELRASGKITSAEYERQRSSIISGV